MLSFSPEKLRKRGEPGNVNVFQKCEGKSAEQKATMDYALCNTKAYEKPSHIVVDEKRISTQTSDHKLREDSKSEQTQETTQKRRRDTMIDRNGSS